MRSSPASALVASVALAALAATTFACGPSTALTVHRLKTGKAAEVERGERLDIKHLDTEKNEGAKSGFVVVKSADEWSKLFAGSDHAPEAPQVDWERKMVVVAVSDWAGTVAMKLHTAVESGVAMYIYAKEDLPGEGCPVKARTALAQDMILVDRTEKPIHFYIERDEATGCGEAPTAKVTCSIDGNKGAEPEIVVKPGDRVECGAGIEATGTFAVVDKTWSFGEFPKSSHAKLEYVQGGERVRFRADVVGRYALRFQVTDEGGRHADGMGIVVSGPGKAPGVYVQLAWGNFDAKDDPKTFPRVILEAEDRERGICSVESAKKPAWCDVKVDAGQTALRVATQEGVFPMRVKYVDDRFAGSPSACLTVFINGSQSAEICDNEPRKAGDSWNLGGLIAKTGTFEAMEMPKPVDPPVVDPQKPTTPTGTKKPSGGGTKPAGGGTKPAGGGGKKPGKKPGSVFAP